MFARLLLAAIASGFVGAAIAAPVPETQLPKGVVGVGVPAGGVTIEQVDGKNGPLVQMTTADGKTHRGPRIFLAVGEAIVAAVPSETGVVLTTDPDDLCPKGTVRIGRQFKIAGTLRLGSGSQMTAQSWNIDDQATIEIESPVKRSKLRAGDVLADLKTSKITVKKIDD